MEIKVPLSLEEIKIVHLDDHLLFSKAMSQQCIYPYFPNACLAQFTMEIVHMSSLKMSLGLTIK